MESIELKASTGNEQPRSVREIMYDRGERDGRAGLNPNSTSSDYIRGYFDGRRRRAEDKLRYGDPICTCH